MDNFERATPVIAELASRAKRKAPLDLSTSLNIANPQPSGKPNLVSADEAQESFAELRITDIHPYDGNPRRSINPNYQAIKESIRARSMESALRVTRRPGDFRYMVAAGGNTRLMAQLELWEETGNPEFERIKVVIAPWRSESHVRLGHLIENHTHADMSFWDTAVGVAQTKADLERERGERLGLRPLEEAFKQEGFNVSKSALSRYLFAVDRLSSLGAAADKLLDDYIKVIQPHFGLLQRYAARFALDEQVLYQSVIDPALESLAITLVKDAALNPKIIGQVAESALAAYLRQPVDRFRTALMLLKTMPELSRSEIEEILNGNGSSSPISRRSSTTDPVQRLNRAVEAFAAAAGCADLLHWHPGMPLGFFVEVPDRRVEDGRNPHFREGWWMLAHLARQLQNSSNPLPENTALRQISQTSPHGEAFTRSIETHVGCMVTAESMTQWLLNPENPMADIFIEAVTAARETGSLSQNSYPLNPDPGGAA